MLTIPLTIGLTGIEITLSKSTKTYVAYLVCFLLATSYA